MARLPSTRYLMQEIGGRVLLFEDMTERHIVRFDASSYADVARAQGVIDASDLGDEDKTYAHFWAGYFAYHAGFEGADQEYPLFYRDPDSGYVVICDGEAEVVRFDPEDRNETALAQKSVYDSGLSPEDKRRAYFWSGYQYAKA